MKKKVALKSVLICLFVLLVYGILQRFQPEDIVLKAPPSIFIEKGIFVPIASFMMYITFLYITNLYIRTRRVLLRRNILSGLLFSLSFIGLWFTGMFEPYLLYNESILFCLFLASIDSVALLLLGSLLGCFIKNEEKGDLRKWTRSSIARIPLITLFFTAGRLFSYCLVGVKSSIYELPLPNILWVILVGASVGFLYWISSAASTDAPGKKAIWFGVCYYGVIWLLYNSFNPLFIRFQITGIGQTSLIDLLIKAIVDIIFVTLGVYVSERIFERQK